MGGAGVIVNHEMRFNLNKRPRKRNRSSPTQSKSNKKVKKPASNETESDQWTDAETVNSDSESDLSNSSVQEHLNVIHTSTINTVTTLSGDYTITAVTNSSSGTSISGTSASRPVLPVVVQSTSATYDMATTSSSYVNQGISCTQMTSSSDQTGTVMQDSFSQPPHAYVDYGGGFPQSQPLISNLPPNMPSNMNLQTMQMPISGPMQSVAPMPTAPISDMDCLRIATMVKNLIKSEINQLVKQEVQQATHHLTKKIVSLQKSNDDLTTQVRDLNGKVDDLEQYGRRMCIRISGVPELQGEIVNDIVMKVGDDINANVSRYDIDRAHRVGRKDDSNSMATAEILDEDITDVQANTAVKTPVKSRDIIVKFTNSSARLAFLKGRKVLREQKSNVFINEDLTAARMKLAFQCRDLKRNNKSRISKTWVFGGNVFVQDKGGIKHKILTLSDLDSFGAKGQAAATGQGAGTQMPV